MWYLLGIADYDKNEIINQINLWEKSILNLNNNQSHLINLALIERYLAALNLDLLMINRQDKIIKMKKILLSQIKRKLKEINLLL